MKNYFWKDFENDYINLPRLWIYEFTIDNQEYVLEYSEDINSNEYFLFDSNRNILGKYDNIHEAFKTIKFHEKTIPELFDTTDFEFDFISY